MAGENSKILPNILHSIGNTPLVRLNRIPQSYGIKCEVLAKVEFFNPGGSVKDRIAYKMIEDAEKQGRIKPGVTTLIEPTSGNTGLGLAVASVVKGYRLIIVIPEKMSSEKIDTLRALGAEIIKTPYDANSASPEGPILTAQRLNKEIPNSVVLDQYNNESNPLAHYEGTGPELYKQCDGKIDMLVAGAGTGGTISGTAKYIRETIPTCKVIAVDPEGSVLALPPEKNKSTIDFYEIEGIGYDFVPNVLHRDLVDEWVKVTDAESLPLARRLIREEGILSGGTAGANLAGALKVCKDLKEGQRCVVVLPDGVRNYMTKFLSDSWMAGRFLEHNVALPEQWWHKEKVSSLELKRATVVAPEKTCEEVVNLLEKNDSRHVVVEKSGEVVGLATDLDLSKWLVNSRVKNEDKISSAPLNRIYPRVVEDTTLLQVHEILQNEPYVAVIDSDKYKGCLPTATQFKVLGLITVKEILQFINKKAECCLIANGSAK